MNTVNPKVDFNDFDSAIADEARKQLPQVWFRKAAYAALAQIAWDGATKEELHGAHKFLDALINIAEKPPEIQRLPVVTLSEYDPTKPSSTAKKGT